MAWANVPGRLQDLQMCRRMLDNGDRGERGRQRKKKVLLSRRRGRAVEGESSRGSWSKRGFERQPPRELGDLHGGVCFDVDESGEECRGSVELELKIGDRGEKRNKRIRKKIRRKEKKRGTRTPSTIRNNRKRE